MKAIVAEIDKKQMIVITDKGDFIKVKRQMSAAIGDAVEIKPQKNLLTYKRLASVAACFLACIFLSTGVYAYYTPYSYVSVDINPSIVMSLNRFERVIAVNPLTEDAVGLISDTKNLKNKDIDKALSEIIKTASEKGYLEEEAENQVMVVVSAKNPKEEDKLVNTVNATASKELSIAKKNAEILVEKTTVENHKTAVSNKVSPGKEILSSKLKELDPEIKDEEIKGMSVKEVASRLNERRKAIKAADKNDKDKVNGRDRDNKKEEHTMNNKQKDEKGKVEAVKPDSRKEYNRNGSDKNKPSAAFKNNDVKGRSNEKSAAPSKTEPNNNNPWKDKKDGREQYEKDEKKEGSTKEKDNKKIKDKDKKKESSEQKGKDDDRSKDKDNNKDKNKDKSKDKDNNKDKEKNKNYNNINNLWNNIKNNIKNRRN